MSRQMRMRLAALALLGAPAVSCGGVIDDFIEDYREANRDSVAAYRIDVENDLFFHTDNNYTDGIRITRKLISKSTYIKTGAGKSWLPGYDLQPHRGREKAGTVYFKKTFNVHLGQNMYTPENISLPAGQIDRSDRPYAAWLYFGVYREVFSSDSRYWKYGADLGCLGPCAQGEQAQKFVHRYLSHSPAPQGWDGQVRNEWGAILRFEYVPQVLQIREHLDLMPRVRIAFGNIQDYAGIEATLRLGQFNSLYESHGADTQAIESVAMAESGTQSDAAPLRENPAPPSESYLFLRGKANLVLYNATLQGGMVNRSSPHTTGNRPEVFEGEFGYVYNDRRGCPLFDLLAPGMKCSLTLGLVRRTSETREQAASPFKAHKFARIQFGWEFD